VLRKTFFILLFALNIKCSGQNTLNNDISISGIIPSNDQIQFPVNNANGRLIYYLFSINYCNFWKIYDRIELGPLLSITTGITKVEFNSDVRNGDRLSSLNYKALGIGLRSRCLLNKKDANKKFFLNLDFQRQIVRAYSITFSSRTNFPNTDYFENTVSTYIKPNSIKNHFATSCTYQTDKKKWGYEFSIGIIYVTPEIYSYDLGSNYSINGLSSTGKKKIEKNGILITSGFGILF
jgi:hypothetical protein